MQPIQTKFFDYGKEQTDYLSIADPVLGAAISRIGKIERIVMPDPFTVLVYAIVGQLISAKAVHTIWENMQIKLGELTPQRLASVTADDIQRSGLTMKKAVCIHQIAEAIVQGKLDLKELNELPDEDVIRKLMALKGVGRWTAEMLLLHAYERPDIVSWGDVAIRRGMMKLYGLEGLTKDQFEQYRAGYSPYGSVASIYLWVISFE